MCHFTKRLHDRNKRGAWLLLLLLAVMLGLTDTSSLEPFLAMGDRSFSPFIYYDDHVVRLWGVYWHPREKTILVPTTEKVDYSSFC